MGGPYLPVEPGRKWFKEITVNAVFLFLGTAMEAAAVRDPDIKKEVDTWENGFTLMMNVLPHGPYMTFEKSDDRLFYRGIKIKDRGNDIRERIAKGGEVKLWGAKLRDVDVIINFKNIECAFMALTPQMGTPQAYAERRLLVKGDLVKVMSFSRCLNVLLAHLYPRFICAILVKRPPGMGLKKQLIRMRIMLDIALGMPRHILKSFYIDL
ncbi:MAG: hypothetical protein AB1724_13720 [Thermodesulfobacteriota bacterium]